MTGRRRFRELWCRIWRGHDDALEVLAVVSGVRVAVVGCDRCGHRRAVPNRARFDLAAEAARFECVIADAEAVDQALWAAEAGSRLVAAMLDRGWEP